MAQALHAHAARTDPLVAWIVLRDVPEHPGSLVARLMTDAPTAYILVAQSLPALRAQLPTGLLRSDRQQSDPPDLVEIWFPA
jgi:hypothetical protein